MSDTPEVPAVAPEVTSAAPAAPEVTAAPEVPAAETPTADPAPAPAPEAPASPPMGPAEALLMVHGAVRIFLDVVGKVRDEELQAATSRAGGDVYKAENHGFDPKKFVILEKAREFLGHLQALK